MRPRFRRFKHQARQYWSFTRFLTRRFQDDECLQAAGSLTFTTLLSLVPLITIALTVVSAFPVFSDLSIRFKNLLLTSLLPDFAGKVITVYMRQFSDNAARLTAVGVVFLGVTALMTMATIDRAFNAIWRVHHKPNNLRRLLVYWAVLTLGPLLIGGSLSVTSWLWTVSRSFGIHWAGLALLKLIPIVLAVGAFTLLYLMVPRCTVPTRHALIAGVLAALAFGVAQAGFGFFIKHFNTYKLVYGAFASLPVFLLWLYITWIILLAGAVFCAALGYWRNQAWLKQNDAGQRFLIAVQILRQLEAAHRQGRGCSSDHLRQMLEAGWDELFATLEALQDAGFIQLNNESEWFLGQSPDTILLADVFRLMVWPAQPIRHGHATEAALLQLRNAMEQHLQHNLASFCREIQDTKAGQ